MRPVITYDNLRNFTYSNDKLCTQPIKGIVLDFFGLGGQSMFGEDTPWGLELAQKGVVLLIPYNNPWAWMNPQAVSYTDEIVSTVMEKYTLPESTPIVSTGGSMGGLSALVYTRYAKRTPVACVANCPVCDLVYHYTERPDLPRTLYSAFGNNSADTLEEAMTAASPLHLAAEMPDVDYFLFHCDEDLAVNRRLHSDRFMEAMRPAHRVVYHTIPERGHCDLPDDMRELYKEYILGAIFKD